jgi:hypothetical protein
MYIVVIVLFTLTLLVSLNTWYIYNLRDNKNTLQIVDLKEFEKLDPEIKELYTKIVVEYSFPEFFSYLDNFIKINGLDNWYNNNKDDIFDLIETLKEIGDKKFPDDKEFELPRETLTKIFNYDIKKINSDLRKQFNLNVDDDQ